MKRPLKLAISPGCLQTLIGLSVLFPVIRDGWGLEAQSDEASAFCKSAKEKTEVRDLSGAVADYTKAIALNSAYLQAYEGRAKVRFSLDDFEGAISDCTKALELSTRNYEIMYLRGRVHQGTGESTQACADYKIALEWAPADWSVRTKVEEYLKKHPESGSIDLLAKKIQAPEEHDNPAYQYWMECPVGSWVKHRMVLQGVRTVVREITGRLVERSPDRLVIETSAEDVPKARSEVKRKGAEFGALEGQGEEEIEVAGKRLKCIWLVSTLDQGEKKTKFKMWFSREIPGGLARYESIPDQGSMVRLSFEATEWGKK